MLLALDEKDNFAEVLYWRKNYELTDYFVALWNLENCEDKVLDEENIEELKQYFKENEGYNEDLKKLNKALKLMTNTQKLVFNAWW